MSSSHGGGRYCSRLVIIIIADLETTFVEQRQSRFKVLSINRPFLSIHSTAKDYEGSVIIDGAAAPNSNSCTSIYLARFGDKGQIGGGVSYEEAACAAVKA